MVLGPTQLPIQWVPGALSLGLKWPGLKLTTHLHVVKNAGSYNSTPQIRLYGAVLGQEKHRDNFPFSLYPLKRCKDQGPLENLTFAKEVKKLPFLLRKVK
jgi:hypothetical protein